MSESRFGQFWCIWANTHLSLVWTACGDGRLAAHMHMPICRVLSGPFTIFGGPTQLSVDWTLNRLESAKQIITVNSTLSIHLDVPIDRNSYGGFVQSDFQVRQLEFQLSIS